MKNILVVFLGFFLFATILTPLEAQDLTAREIIEKSDQKLRGKSSRGEMKMTIIRPSWTREMSMKMWSLGDEFSLVVVTAPARDKGTGFLKRDKEIWNWQPTIDRVIKLPPSMMMQSWLGSDFTNDDLIRESTILKDYDHSLVGTETIEERECYQIEMIPTEEAAVVWGKLIVWIDKVEFIQLKTEFYDEDDYLVNTMLGKEIKDLGGKQLASVLEVIPADEDGHMTKIEYMELVFDEPIKESFFSVQNMKRAK